MPQPASSTRAPGSRRSCRSRSTSLSCSARYHHIESSSAAIRSYSLRSIRRVAPIRSRPVVETARALVHTPADCGWSRSPVCGRPRTAPFRTAWPNGPREPAAWLDACRVAPDAGVLRRVAGPGRLGARHGHAHDRVVVPQQAEGGREVVRANEREDVWRDLAGNAEQVDRRPLCRAPDALQGGERLALELGRTLVDLTILVEGCDEDASRATVPAHAAAAASGTAGGDAAQHGRRAAR